MSALLPASFLQVIGDLSLTPLNKTPQRANPANHQKLPRKIVRGPRPAVLPALADGQPHLRRERRRLLAGARLPGARAALAARLARDRGRGLCHLCAVPAVLAQEAGEGWGGGLGVAC